MLASQPLPEDRALALVAMPWSQKDRPSAALAALSAYARRERPGWRVDVFSEFLEVAAAIGQPAYDALARDAYGMGEIVYMALLYPEKAASVRARYVEWAREHSRAPAGGEGDGVRADHEAGRAFDALRSALQSHLEHVATRLASYRVVGLTTCFGQLFANLALARAIKQRSAVALIVLGGSTVSARVGPSILGEYPFVDLVIQGEGESPLAGLLAAVERGEGIPQVAGIVAREGADGASPAKLSEVGNLDDLPIPDFDEYAARAEQLGISWALPIESSRGCWWDRTRRSGNPKSTCFFCNLNVQWGGYREKSVDRVARELGTLAARHQNLRAYFIDNIVRHRGVTELAEALVRTNLELDVFYEMRANIRPYEFLVLWEAGLTATQFGIEGLSTSYLRRIGKGTTVIQNLQAMRLCTELGVRNAANLIVDFPGATQAEVDETVRVIETSALGFEPLELTSFHLGVDSTVDTLREEFGVVRVRNADVYRTGLPHDVWERLRMFDLDFDLARPGVDWGPVKEARRRWVELRGAPRDASSAARDVSAPRPLLVYSDGDSFLTITDYRFGEPREGSFDGAARDIYLACTEIQSFEQLARRYRAHDIPDADLRAALRHFVDNRIMYEEDDRYLSLAVARSPRRAARRIREAWAAQQARPAPAAVRLPLVS